MSRIPVTIEDDLKPGRWPVKRTAGDTDVPVTFTLEWDGLPVVVSSAFAQVRVRQDRGSTEVYERTCDVTGLNSVQVGAGDVIPNTPGKWYWDLQVDGTVGALDVSLTFVGGPFIIVRDTSVLGS